MNQWTNEITFICGKCIYNLFRKTPQKCSVFIICFQFMKCAISVTQFLFDLFYYR